MQVSQVVDIKQNKYLLTCNREDQAFIQKHSMRAALMKGNYVSSLRYHIRSHHFDVYQRRCVEAGIEMHHRAVPPELLSPKPAKKTGGTQTTLDAALAKVVVPKEFSKTTLLRAVAQFVVCDNQVSRILMLKKWILS